MMSSRKTGAPIQLGPRPEAPEHSRAWLHRAAMAVAFVALVASMTREPDKRTLSVDDIDTAVLSRDEIRADFYFEAVDLQKTKEARNEAAAKVPDNFRVDTTRVNDQLEKVRALISRISLQRDPLSARLFEALRKSDSTQTPEDIVRQEVSAFAASLKESDGWQDAPSAAVLAQWLTPDLATLPQRVFETPPAEEPAKDKRGKAAAEAPAEPKPPVLKTASLQPAAPTALGFSTGDQLAALALESLEYVLKEGIRSATLPPGADTRTIVILRDEPLADLAVTSGAVPLKDVPDPQAAEQILAERLRETTRRAASPEADDNGVWARLHEAAMAVAKPGLAETIELDRVATAGAIQAARDAVPEVVREIEAGEIVQEGGRRWTEQSRSDVKTYVSILAKEQQSPQRLITTTLANALVVLLVMAALRRALPMFLNDSEEESIGEHVLPLALLLMAGMAALGRVASYFEPTGFLLPLAAAGILFAILVNVRAAALFSLLMVFVVSAQYNFDWRLIFVQSAMTLAGIFSITKVRRRSDMTKASLKATLAGIVAIIAILLAMDSMLSNTAVQRVTMIILNGGICLMAVPALLSPLERLFSITTDIQLLEYSDLNNEVLSKLALEIPGTFSHSLMLGQLAEAAADAVGANGLKARVMAYYHDIGKMWRPEYFCENQTDRNVHDELAPRLSARAIAAHVTQGAEMARRMYRLPKPIIDGILEHHGTARIGFFYEEAIKQKRHGDVDERDFRYPGPKPQSPETAILMICDGAESASRTLKNPNEERVRELVDKIIGARAADRQFDDCNLTMKQLDTIAEVVTLRICSNQHRRVAYPSSKREDDNNIIPMAGTQS